MKGINKVALNSLGAALNSSETFQNNSAPSKTVLPPAREHRFAHLRVSFSEPFGFICQCTPIGPTFGCSWAFFGSCLDLPWALFGRSWDLLSSSWSPLRHPWAPLGNSVGTLGQHLALSNRLLGALGPPVVSQEGPGGSVDRF